MSEQQPRGSDPTQWVQRAPDPLLLSVKKEVKRLAWVAPAIAAATTLISGSFAAAMAWSAYRANQVTLRQFESERTERIEGQQRLHEEWIRVDAKLDALLLQGKKGRNH